VTVSGVYYFRENSEKMETHLVLDVDSHRRRGTLSPHPP